MDINSEVVAVSLENWENNKDFSISLTMPHFKVNNSRINKRLV